MKRIKDFLLARRAPITVGTLILLIVLIALSGCAAPQKIGAEWYGEVGIGYQLDEQTDVLRRTDQPYECSANFPTHFEVGLDWGNARLGYHHQSWLLCGGPFYNDRPETYADDIRFTYRFGGK